MSRRKKVKVELEYPSSCCYPMMYGTGAIGGGYGGGLGHAKGFGGGPLAWFYALLVLIVIVLQFGRRFESDRVVADKCCDGGTTACTTGFDGFFGKRDGLIDNSVLFIIVVFLLILCAGCWWGGGFGGGYGYY